MATTFYLFFHEVKMITTIMTFHQRFGSLESNLGIEFFCDVVNSRKLRGDNFNERI
jgi:hypothetical protein